MKATKLFTTMAAIAILAACNKNNDITPVTPQDDLKDTPITVSAAVEGMNTRAGYEGTSVLPETFYLTITQDTEDATSPYNYTNVDMTKGSGNNYTPSTNLLWKDGTRSPFVSAYTTADATFTVLTDQSTAESVIASDLLGAVSTTEGDVTIDGDNISVRFRHLLCKLDVTYSWGTEFDNVTTKSIKNVVYNGFGTDITLDRTTATITSGTYTDLITAFVGKTMVDEVEKDMSEAIFAPQTGNPKIVITALIDGVERTFSLNVTPPTDGFASGKRYTMAIKIGGTGAEISRVSVNDWTEKPVTGVETEQEAFVYNPATNTYEVHLARGMQAAIDAAELTGIAENPAKVTLLADMEVAGTPNEYGNIDQDILVDGGVITLDLNGHTITSTSEANYVIMVDNGAELTIDDSSEEKQGKIKTVNYYAVRSYNGKLVINGGIFEGEYAAVCGWENNSTIEINGGTFIGTDDAIYAQSSILSITGGTFTGGRYALYFTRNGKPTITGGSFSGGEYDIYTYNLTRFLSYNEETGEGPTFPGGLSISGTSNNLNALLANGAAYYDAEGNPLTLASNATTCEGSVTVKKVNE